MSTTVTSTVCDEMERGNGRRRPRHPCPIPVSLGQDSEDERTHDVNMFQDKLPTPGIKDQDMYELRDVYHKLPWGVGIDLTNGNFLNSEDQEVKDDFDLQKLRELLGYEDSTESENVFSISASGLHEDTKEALHKTRETGTDFPKEVLYFQPGEAWGNISDVSYQTTEELQTIRRNIEQIVMDIGSSKVIFELGPGTFHKTEVILDQLEDQKVERFYVAVDVNRAGLQKIAKLNAKYEYIKCIGLMGTFDQALVFALKLASTYATFRDSVLMSFGSTFSNNAVEDLMTRMKMWRFMASYVLLGQDSIQLTEEVHNTYHSEAYYELLWSGLREGDKIIGGNVFSSSKRLECAIEKGATSSHAFRLQTPNGVIFNAFKSIKYSEGQMSDIIQRAGFRGGVFGEPEPETTGMRLYHMKRSKLDLQDNAFWECLQGLFRTKI